MARRRKDPELPDLSDLRKELDHIPSEPVPKSHPRNWLWRIKRTTDFIGHARPSHASFFRAVNPYPKPFQHVKFETEDGVTIAAWYGPMDGARGGHGLSGKAKAAAKAAEGDDEPKERPPLGIVLVPGMFSTKDDSIHKRRAIWLWRHWQVPVLCIDMRAFGESNGIATGAWKEAYDVHAAAKFLKETAGVERVGVIAESMGGASTLNAMAHDAETGSELITGGALLWSPFVDMRDAVHYISSEPPADDPFHAQWAAFRRLLRYRSHGGYERFDEYLDDAARVNGLDSFDEMADLANPKWKVSLIKAPVMILHASDDPVVPVRHARRMERYAKDRLHIQVIVKPFGGHTGFESMDPEWYWEVTRRFFSAINGIDLPHPAHPKH